MSFGQLERHGAAEPLHEINVTPLVDVMLVLLVIFIVTAPLLTHKIKVNLPKLTATASASQHPMVISLTREAALFLDGQQIGGEELQAVLRGYLARGVEPTVELRAEATLEYEHIVRLMALIQDAGVRKLSFLTEPRSGAATFNFPRPTPSK